MNIHEINNEITRLKKLLERPNYRYKNTTQIMIQSYEFEKWKKRNPILWSVRDKLGTFFISLGSWIRAGQWAR